MAHEHGKMSTREQEKTFNGFLKLAMGVGGVAIAVLIFLALANS